MGRHSVTLIPGDGVGPEICDATVRVLEATGVEFDWDVQQAGEAAIAEFGTPLPEHVLASIRKNKVAIKGPITTPVGSGFRSVNVALRLELDLYALVRPVKAYKGARNLRDDLDFVIVRENTEDLYAGLEFERGTPDCEHLITEISGLLKKKIRPDSGLSIKPISVSGTKRIVEFAFDYARKNKRRKVTAVHKANIMKHTDGLFLSVARQVAAQNPDIEFEDRIVDNMCMQLVLRPKEYDVLCCPNLYGDIISDLGAGMIGGLGLAPGANIGT
ncbi:MAG: isocitrate/isopropylmalate dehydrogenase family protein, partial [Solirubrobacterales bacterium]